MLSIDVWSDIACPWCYIGKRHLEAALAELDIADAVEVRWRAFELDPSAPKRRDPSVSYVERLARKYRVPADQAQQMIDRMVNTAAGEGLDFRFDIIQSGNTFDAHRLLHYAGGTGRQGALKERLLAAYFTEGEAISDHATLTRLAVDAGLDADAVAAILATDAHAAEVRADQLTARTMGVSGVPFFLVDGRFGVPGAQPTEVMVKVLEQVRTELAEAASCSVDGC